jgi:hypothetical protein
LTWEGQRKRSVTITAKKLHTFTFLKGSLNTSSPEVFVSYATINTMLPG